jgi:hypothetical protein
MRSIVIQRTRCLSLFAPCLTSSLRQHTPVAEGRIHQFEDSMSLSLFALCQSLSHFTPCLCPSLSLFLSRSLYVSQPISALPKSLSLRAPCLSHYRSLALFLSLALPSSLSLSRTHPLPLSVCLSVCLSLSLCVSCLLAPCQLKASYTSSLRTHTLVA